MVVNGPIITHFSNNDGGHFNLYQIPNKKTALSSGLPYNEFSTNPALEYDVLGLNQRAEASVQSLIVVGNNLFRFEHTVVIRAVGITDQRACVAVGKGGRNRVAAD